MSAIWRLGGPQTKKIPGEGGGVTDVEGGGVTKVVGVGVTHVTANVGRRVTDDVGVGVTDFNSIGQLIFLILSLKQKKNYALRILKPF